MIAECYGNPLSNIELNNLFFEEETETYEINNHQFFNINKWEEDCLRNYEDCRLLKLPTTLSKEDFKIEIQKKIKNILYTAYKNKKVLIL